MSGVGPVNAARGSWHLRVISRPTQNAELIRGGILGVNQRTQVGRIVFGKGTQKLFYRASHSVWPDRRSGSMSVYKQLLSARRYLMKDFINLLVRSGATFFAKLSGPADQPIAVLEFNLIGMCQFAHPTQD